jgi:hypothetical protein
MGSGAFEKPIRIKARLSVVPQAVETLMCFSGCGKPMAEADSLVKALAASLKRCPDTNFLSNCATTS